MRLDPLFAHLPVSVSALTFTQITTTTADVRITTGLPLIAFAFQVLLLAYHQITTLVDFYPFNGARYNKGWAVVVECLSNGILMILPPLGYLLKIHGLVVFGVGYYFFLFVGELWTWWKPYFFGTNAKWQAYYEKVHAQTIHIFPARGKNPRPNLEHTILMGLTIVTAVVTLMAYLRS